MSWTYAPDLRRVGGPKLYGMQGVKGFDRPCRAPPADRSLVAEDRSASGVRDQTGLECPMLTRLLTGRAATPRDARVQDETTLRRSPSL
jgi:hypothetical protein